MSKKQVAPKKLKKETTSKIQKEQEAEIARQRKLVKDIVYAWLVKNTKSVTEAKRLCHEVQSAMTQSFQTMVAAEQNRLSELETRMIPIMDITKKGEGFNLNKELYALLGAEKVSVTNALLGGMSQAIASFENEEMSIRGLDTLKATFL